MKTIQIKNPGKDSQLEVVQSSTPKIQSDEILIQVHAFALNHADLLQRAGKYPSPDGATDIPGLELSGEIVQIGQNTEGFKKGDSVYALVSGGAYSEYCTAHHKLVKKLPDSINFEAGCAIPEALMTAHATLIELGQLKKDDSLLMHGAGSGITSFAAQMASIIGARTLSTIGVHSKKNKALDLGIHQIFNHHDKWYDCIKKDSIDVIVDFIGGDYVSEHLKLLTLKGKLIQIACMKNHRFEASLIPIMTKQLCIYGFMLRPQSISNKALLWTKAHQMWQQYLSNHTLQPLIDSIFDFEDIEKAHQRLKNSEHFGKIVVLGPN